MLFWVVRCTLPHHCHHCHCYYQKCQYWIITFVYCKKSSFHSIRSCNKYFATSAENRCGRDACGAGDGGGVGGTVWWFCVRRRKTVTQSKRLLGNATGRRLQIFFKEQSKQSWSHQTIQGIHETRGTTPTFGLPTGNNIGERSMQDIVNWSPEFISM